jgi:hypothetical protein
LSIFFAVERNCQLDYDTASDRFAPEGIGSGCSYASHMIVAAKDYVLAAYGKR